MVSNDPGGGWSGRPWGNLKMTEDFSLCWTVIALWVLFASLLDFTLMGVDKWKARRGLWRIPERTLWFFALLGGAVGGFAAMHLFHHKTRHWYFRWGFPILSLLQFFLLVWLRFG